MLSDAAWVWLSPLLIVLGCMGLLWSFRSLLQWLGTAAVGASRIRGYRDKLRGIEVLGMDSSSMLEYLFVYIPSLLLILAFTAILGIVALAAFLKLADVTGLGFLMEYINRRF